MPTKIDRQQYFKEFDELYQQFKQASAEMAGYPGNQFFDYSQLFRFLEFSINNIGDPFQQSSHYRINSHKFEKEVINMFAEILHAPKHDYWGYVTNGGTEGNLYGLYLARQLYPEGIVYYSDQAHYSIPKNIDLLRMESVEIKSLPNGEIDYQMLQDELLKNPHKAPIIVANIGTTMVGAIDDVMRIMEILSDLRIKEKYVHCDAAFFGMLLPYISELKAQPFDFRTGIDSVAISGHKMVGTPMPCGVVIAKKSNVDKIGNNIEYTGSKDNTITGSRNGLTPLLLWYELKCAERQTIEEIVHDCIERAGYAVKKFNENQIKAWRNKNSIIVVLPKPSEKIIKRWQLASEGDIAHLITLPQVTYELIDKIIADIVAEN